MDRSAGSNDGGFEYDRIAYPGTADGQIQLRNLEVVASMFGLHAAEIGNCRVLEIGCADGTNLLPFAAEFPDSEFVGLDLASARIQEAESVATSLNLHNIRFVAKNVTEIDSSYGKFDYVLCPGVFSWATETERQAILRLCRENLTDSGVAAISYNVLPGWHFRGTVRDYIRRHVRVFDDPGQQIVEARRAIEFIVRCTSGSTAHGLSYSETCDSIRTATDHYLYHDYISDRNQAFYFHEFAALLEDHDLQFVAESDIRQTAAVGLRPEARQTLQRTSILDREQLLDFLANTCYRRSVVGHRGAKINRTIDHTSINGCFVALASPFRGLQFDPANQEPLQLTYEEGTLTTAEPLGKAALRHLMGVWPQAVSVSDIYQAACQILPTSLHQPDGQQADGPTGVAVLSQALLAAYAAGVVRVFRTPPTVVASVSERPIATALVRHIAAKGGTVVNQWHQNVAGLQPDELLVLSQLDGSNNVAALVTLLEDFRRDHAVANDAGAPSPVPAEKRVRAILNQLATERLLLIE